MQPESGPTPLVHVEVTISDLLRRLLAGDLPEPDPPSDPAPEPQALGPDPVPPVPEVPGPWEEIFLRCDGQRPTGFWGLPVHRQTQWSDGPCGPTERRIALYLARDQTLYAAVSILPPDTAPARPLFGTAAILHPDDYHALLARLDMRGTLAGTGPPAAAAALCAEIDRSVGPADPLPRAAVGPSDGLRQA